LAHLFSDYTDRRLPLMRWRGITVSLTIFSDFRRDKTGTGTIPLTSPGSSNIALLLLSSRERCVDAPYRECI